MNSLLSSDLLFYGGMAIMLVALAAGAICAVIFCITGRRLKQKLEQEYGKPICWKPDTGQDGK